MISGEAEQLLGFGIRRPAHDAIDGRHLGVDHVTHRRERRLLERADRRLVVRRDQRPRAIRVGRAQLLAPGARASPGATARPRAAGATNTLWMYASYFDMRSVRPSSGTSIGPRAAHAMPAGRMPSVASTALIAAAPVLARGAPRRAASCSISSARVRLVELVEVGLGERRRARGPAAARCRASTAGRDTGSSGRTARRSPRRCGSSSTRRAPARRRPPASRGRGARASRRCDIVRPTDAVVEWPHMRTASAGCLRRRQRRHRSTRPAPIDDVERDAAARARRERLGVEQARPTRLRPTCGSTAIASTTARSPSSTTSAAAHGLARGIVEPREPDAALLAELERDLLEQRGGFGIGERRGLVALGPLEARQPAQRAHALAQRGEVIADTSRRRRSHRSHRSARARARSGVAPPADGALSTVKPAGARRCTRFARMRDGSASGSRSTRSQVAASSISAFANAAPARSSQPGAGEQIERRRTRTGIAHHPQLARVEQRDLHGAAVQRREADDVAGLVPARRFGRAADQHVELGAERVVVGEPPRDQPVGAAKQRARADARERPPFRLRAREARPGRGRRRHRSPFASRTYHGASVRVAVGNGTRCGCRHRLTLGDDPCPRGCTVGAQLRERRSFKGACVMHACVEPVGAVAVRRHRESALAARAPRARASPRTSASATGVCPTTSPRRASFSAVSSEQVA